MGYVEQYIEIYKKRTNTAIQITRHKVEIPHQQPRISKKELIRLWNLHKSEIQLSQQTIRQYETLIRTGQLDEYAMKIRQEMIQHREESLAEHRIKIAEIEILLTRMNYTGDDDAE